MANFFKKVGQAVADVVGVFIPHTPAAQMRAQASQMDLYKSQKDALEKETNRVNQERDLERTRLHEKQIRSMRRAFRSPGFLEGPQANTVEKLG